MELKTQQIVDLLDSRRPAEVRRAAVIVLGELAGRDAAVGRALCSFLDDPDAALRVEVLRAVGKLRVEAALPQLLERIKAGGEEAELAAQAAARLGAKGTKGLQELLPRVAPGLRRYIASALAGGGTASAGTAAVEMLLDSDPGVIEATTRSFLTQIHTLSASQKHQLADRLLEVLEQNPPAGTEAAVVRLLVALEDDRAAEALWERVLPPHSTETRAAALQALGKWLTAPNREQLKRLFACASDRDFRIAAPALMLLQAVPVDGKTRDGWLSLLKAPDRIVRLEAVKKLGDQDTAEVAEGLLEQLSHPDRDLREAALARLARLKQGQLALTRNLLQTDSVDRAWALAKAQAAHAKSFSPEWRKQVFEAACERLEAEDRKADPLLFLLREADPVKLRDDLEERALAHRKKKDYEKALPYLRHLVRDPACAFSVRLEMAAVSLKLSAHDLTQQARADDPCLHQFAGLVHHHEDELLPALEQIKWLDPEDLYYLGFDFVEREGPSKKFGGEVLKLVVQRAGRTKLGQAAKSKLKGG